MEMEFLSAIDRKRDELIKLADTVWENPEILFKEYKSSAAVMDYLSANGFTIEKNVAGLPTAFIASYGSGHPEIGFIAEYDAIANQSQMAGVPEPVKDPNCVHGHACGHHLYCSNAVAAALAVQEYLKTTGKPGTVKVLGCPAEEGGGGKAYMARAGAFSSLDAAMGGHPEAMWAVRTRPSLACCTIRYSFDGRAAHASKAEQGRSALDAVELMNIAVNFLREHIPGDQRVHYAITDTGGIAPNVVQHHAEVMYMMRAKNNADLKELCQRVHKCAEGAAIATETSFVRKFHSGSSNLITIPTLQKNLYKAMAAIALPQPDEADIAFGEAFIKNIVNRDPKLPLYPTELLPLPDVISPHFGSTDTGDVSWNCPTVQMHVGCWIPGSVNHSWHTVAQGKNHFAREAMLYTGKALALAAVQLFENPELLAQARKEHFEKTGGIYDPAMPADVMPDL